MLLQKCMNKDFDNATINVMTEALEAVNTSAKQQGRGYRTAVCGVSVPLRFCLVPTAVSRNHYRMLYCLILKA